MTTFTHTMTETFHVVSCYTCGVPFGITAELHRRVVLDAKGSVFCPACGKLTCWTESEAKKKERQLRQELESAERRAATAKRRADQESKRADSAERSLSATRGVVTRQIR